MLNVIKLNVIMLNVIMLSVIMLSVIMLSVIMLNDIILNGIMPSVVMLNVISPSHSLDGNPFLSISCSVSFNNEYFLNRIKCTSLPDADDESCSQRC
jgi:hypothetical protein